MTRHYCDRCGVDVTNRTSASIHGIGDGDADGNGRVTHAFNHVCRRCYREFLRWMTLAPKRRP